MSESSDRREIRLVELKDKVSAEAFRELEAIVDCIDDIEEREAEIRELREERDAAIAKAIDVFQVLPAAVMDVSGLTSTRLNQILAEQSS